MSVTLYDNALLKKIKYWIKDNNITVLGVNESTDLFKYRADISNDKPLTLPLISLSRNPRIEIKSINKKPLTYDGLKLESENGRTNQLNAIPIKITYQLDVYTRYSDEAQEYMRNFIFNFINYPKLDMQIPYNDSSIVINSYIHINPEFEDNSDIPERLIRDQFNRQTLSFDVDAYLYDYRAYDNWKISLEDIILLMSDIELKYAKDSIEVKIEGE